MSIFLPIEPLAQMPPIIGSIGRSLASRSLWGVEALRSRDGRGHSFLWTSAPVQGFGVRRETGKE